MNRTHTKLRDDIGGEQLVDLDARHAGNGAAIFASATRLHARKAGTREAAFRILLQTALRRHGENERRAHGSVPISFSRSIHTAKPTAGIGATAPRRESSSS